MSRAKRYARKGWNYAKRNSGRVSNGRDAKLAGKLGLAGVVAYGANLMLNKTADKIKQYSPGYLIRKAVTTTEKGYYNLDKKVERELKRVPGGKNIVAANKGLVGKVWDMVPFVSVGGPDKPRTKKFYERTKIPMPFTRTKKTVATTRVPSRYNVNAANQKGLLGYAGMGINALLGLYVAKEGAKYAYRRIRGRKKKK